MIEQEIRNRLFSLQDLEYKTFHQKLCSTRYSIIGVRIPLIRNLVKEYITKYTFFDLYNIKPIYYEEIIFKGLLIGNYKSSFNDIKKLIKEFIPLIDNWAVCDTFCSSLKITKKYSSEMRQFIMEYFDSKKEYELRFLIVMVLDYYITDVYLMDNFKVFDSIHSDDYYVNMALAWAISICLIKYYDETINYLKNAKISDFVYKKSLQKTIESFRINDEQKKQLRKLKDMR